jgi:hypothetical protein
LLNLTDDGGVAARLAEGVAGPPVDEVSHGCPLT